MTDPYEAFMDGRDVGYNAGFDVGYEEGFEQGRDAGYNEGFAAGLECAEHPVKGAKQNE